MNIERVRGRTDFDSRIIPAGAVESRWLAPDGYRMRRIDWPADAGAPRGSLLYLPGRDEVYARVLRQFSANYGQGDRKSVV